MMIRITRFNIGGEVRDIAEIYDYKRKDGSMKTGYVDLLESILDKARERHGYVEIELIEVPY